MKRLVIILNLIVCFQLLNAQIDKEFWFAIPKETANHGTLNVSSNVSFKFSNPSDVLPAHVEISMPANINFETRTLDVPPGQTYRIILATTFTEFQGVYSNPSVWNATATSGFTNHGIFIKSSNDISVYYDYDNYYNRDLFTLKGKNALGTEFFTPFQTIWNNGASYSPDVPLSSANIVATEDGTTVWIYPTKVLQGRTDLSPFSVTLNRGQTYTIVAKSIAAADHFSGTRIVSVDPDKPIAVTINDDSVNPTNYSCNDIVGDQIIPTSALGSNYLVMTGTNSSTAAPAAIQQPLRTEQIFVTGTQDGTSVEFIQKDGTVLYSTTINAQQTTYVTPDITNSDQTAIYVHATNPVYVFHITGISCEVGGAIVPPLSNCTGSNEVSFFRSSISSNGSSTMELNLMIPYDITLPFNSPSQPFYFFRINRQDGTSVPIPPTSFEEIPGAGMAVLNSSYRGNAGIGTLIPINQSVKITNSKGFFHLGVLNGYSGTTNKYGYFSGFGPTLASATIWPDSEGTVIKCFGDTVCLKATGGYEYNWHYGSPNGPATYLNDSLSSTPRVLCPPGQHDFFVVIRSSCRENDTLKVSVQVLPKAKAEFEVENSTGCAPFQAKITNKSTATSYSWTYQRNNDPAVVFTPSSQSSFTIPSAGYFENNTSTPVTYKYQLRALYNGECFDTTSRRITVYPKVKACINPKDTTVNSNSMVLFRNNSEGNIVSYLWNFGDGSGSNLTNSSHAFLNNKPVDTTYNVRLIASSNYACRDTAYAKVTVHSDLKANFNTEVTAGCSPFHLKLINTSTNRSSSNRCRWDFGDGTLLESNSDTVAHIFINNSSNITAYKVILAIRNEFTTDTISKTIIVYPGVKAAVTPSDTTINSNSMVSFRNNSEGDIASYLWNFGDGSCSNLVNSSHVFINNKSADTTFNVKLIAVSNYGCHDTASAIVTIHSSIKANFTSDATTGCSPLSVRVINTSTNNKSITQSTWDFGDGDVMQSSKDTLTHVFTNSTFHIINYKVQLTVKNQFTTDTASRIITVYPEVIADFTSSQESGKSPLSVTFTNKSKASSYEWDFGDNTSSNLLNPTHTFVSSSQEPKDFTVLLTAKSAYNCIDTFFNIIRVLPDCRAIADFTPSMYSGQNPMTVTFVNNSSNFDASYWEFGDSTTSNEKSPDHLFNTKNNTITEYEVKLIVSKLYCSTDSVTHTIMVYPGTIANVENQDLSLSKVKVFPNPAHDKFKVQYTLDKLSDVTIELISPSGASIKKFDTVKEAQGEYHKTLDFGAFNGDLLFVKISIDGNSTILKVIRQ